MRDFSRSVFAPKTRAKARTSIIFSTEYVLRVRGFLHNSDASYILNFFRNKYQQMSILPYALIRTVQRTSKQR